MKIKIRQPQHFCEIGKKDNQEDFLWPNPAKVSDNQRIFIMCDGVGGQDNGEVASETAATALGVYLTSHRDKNGYVTEAVFNEALNYAYDELDKKANGAQKKMGTTMTCVVLHRGGALVAHIGDSRIYHVRPSLVDVENGRSGIIYQSADHSLVNDLLRAGEISEEEAKNFPQKNVITRAMQPNLERRHKADIINIDDIQNGDYFFLCCDGVLEQLANEKLGAILAEDAFDDNGKISAIKSICDRDTKDNYTCWLIPIDKVDREATDVVSEDELEATVIPTEQDSVNTEKIQKTVSMPISVNENQKQENQVISSSLSLKEPAQKKSKKSLLIILFLIAIVAGAFLGRYVFTGSNEQKLEELMDSAATEQKEEVKATINSTPAKPAVKETQQEKIPQQTAPKKEKVKEETKSAVVNQLKEAKPQEQAKPEETNPTSTSESPSSSSVKNSLLKNNTNSKEQPDGKQL